MAGLFGFLDVTKEGPGVNKNGPKKRPFVVFFEVYGRKFWNLIWAGVLFLFVNLPLVTRGWADVGLTYITRAFSREKHAFVREDFFDTIRKNRKQALICGLINQIVTGILLYNLFFYLFGLMPELYGLFGVDTTGATPMTLKLTDQIVIGCTLLGYVLFTFMKYYIPFLVVTFQLSIRKIYRNAMIFSMAGLKANLLISGVLILLYGLIGGLMVLVPQGAVFILIPALLLVPGFRSLLIQFAIFPTVKKLMIDPYYKENPDADKQKRLDLGLEIEDAAPAEEPVFTDTVMPPAETTDLPKQYSEQELRQRRTQGDDEDDTTI